MIHLYSNHAVNHTNDNYLFSTNVPHISNGLNLGLASLVGSYIVQFMKGKFLFGWPKMAAEDGLG